MSKIVAILGNFVSVAGVFVLLTIVVLFVASRLLKQERLSMPLIRNAAVVTDGKVLPANEGRLVLVSGTITAEGTASDPDFDVTVQSPCLERVVEVYMKRHKYENNKKVEYNSWEQFRIKDKRFDKTIENHAFYSSAKIGEFELSPDCLDKLESPKVRVHELPQSAADKYGMKLFKNGTYYLPNEREGLNKVIADLLEVDESAGYSEGDARISYRMIDPAQLGVVTILAKQQGGVLTTCYPSGKEGEYPINKIYDGVVSLDEVIRQEESSYKVAKIAAGVIVGIVSIVTLILVIRKFLGKGI